MQENVILNYLMTGNAAGLVSALEQALAGLRASSGKVAKVEKELNDKVFKQALRDKEAFDKKLAALDRKRIKELERLAKQEKTLRASIFKQLDAGKISGTQLRRDPIFGRFIEGSVAKSEGSQVLKQRVGDAIKRAFEASRAETVKGIDANIAEVQRTYSERLGKVVADATLRAQRRANELVDAENKKRLDKELEDRKRSQAEKTKLSEKQTVEARRQADKQAREDQRRRERQDREQRAAAERATKAQTREAERQAREQKRAADQAAKEQARQLREIDVANRAAARQQARDAARQAREAERARRSQNQANAIDPAINPTGQPLPETVSPDSLRGRSPAILASQLRAVDEQRANVLRRLVETGREERAIRAEILRSSGQDRINAEARLAVVQNERNRLKETNGVLKSNRDLIRSTVRDLVQGGQDRGFLGDILKIFGTGLLLQGLRNISFGVKDVLGSVLQTAAEFQKLETSFVSILADNRLREGSVASIKPEDLASLRVESQGLFREAQIAAVQTVATTKEYVELLQTSLAVGRNVGLTQEEILELTKRFALAGGAFGIEFEKISTSIAQIFAGSVRVTNQLARNLGLATKEQRDQLKTSIAQGRLFDFLERKTRGFGATAQEVADNFSNVASALQDIFELGGTAAFEPLFRFLNQELIKLRDRFFTGNTAQPFSGELIAIIDTIKSTITAILPDIRTAAASFADLVTQTFRLLNSPDGISGFTVALRTLIGVLNTLTTIIETPFLRTLIVTSLAARGVGLLTSGLVSLGRSIATSVGGFTSLFGNVRAAGQLFVSEGLRARSFGGAVQGLGLLATESAAGFALLSTGINAALGLVSLATLAYFAFSNAADEAAQKQEDLNRALRSAQNELDTQFNTNNLQQQLRDFVDLADFKNRTKEQAQELDNLRAKLVATLGPELVKTIENGGVKAELEDVRAALRGVASEAETQAQAVRGFFEARQFISRSTTSLSDQVFASGQNLLEYRNSIKALVDSIQQSGSSFDLTAAEAFRLENELLRVDRQIGFLVKSFVELNRLGNETSLEDILGDEDLQKQFTNFIKDSAEQIVKFAERAKFSAQSIEDQSVALSNTVEEVERLRQQIASSNITERERTELLDRYNKLREVQGVQNEELNKSIATEAALRRVSVKQVIEENIVIAERTIKTYEGIRAKYADAAASYAQVAASKEAAAAIADETEAVLLREQGSQAAAQARQAGLEARAAQEIIDDANRRIEQFRDKLRALGTRAAGGDGGKRRGAGGAGGRDELTDFLALLDRQLDQLRKSGDLLEKELDRVIDIRRKFIQSLVEAGQLTPAEGAVREIELVQKQFEAARKLSLQRERLLEADIRQARILAQRQDRLDQEQEARRQKRAAKANVEVGEDRRQRALEAVEKLEQKRLDNARERAEAFRKAEQEIDEISSRQVQKEIELIQQRRKLTDELSGLQEESNQFLTQQLNEAALLSDIEAIERQLESQKRVIEIEREAIRRELTPVQDPEFRALLEKARADSKQFIQTILDPKNRVEFLNEFEARFKALEQATNRYSELNQKIQEAAVKTKGKSSKELVDLKEEAKQTADGIQTLNSEIINLAAQAGLDPEAIARFARARQTLLQLEETDARNRQLAVEEAKLNERTLQVEADALSKKIRLAESQLQLERSIVEVQQNNLAIQEQLVSRRVELGVITEQQARREQARLQQQQLLVLEVQREQAIKRVTNLLEGRRAIANFFGVSDLQIANNPAFKQIFSDAANEVNRITSEMNLLKLTLLETNSATRAAASGLRIIGQVFAGLSGVNQSLSLIAPVFEGVASLFDQIFRQQAQKTAAEQIIDAGDRFYDRTVEAGQRIIEAGNIFANRVTRTQPPRDTGRDSRRQQEEALKNQLKLPEIVGIISSTAASVASALLSGGDAGQKISGLGSAATSLSQLGNGALFGGTLGKVVGALGPIGSLVQVFGGIVSFFGATARKKTAELAETLTGGINDLKRAIANGTIGIGEGLRQLQSRLESARRQLSGRKGGREELKKIEDDVKAEQERLREEARRIQKEFRDNLDLLRQPKELRDTIEAINAIQKSVEDFLKSFENPADALNALGEAQEFVRRSIGELEDEIKKTLEGLQTDLKEATEDFRKSQRDILLQGRVDPVISEAENKKRQLVELDKEFRARQKELKEQIAGEQKKLDFVEKRKSLEQEIAKLVENSAQSLSSAAGAFERAIAELRRVADGWFRGTASSFSQSLEQINRAGFGSTPPSSMVNSGNLYITVHSNGSDGRQIAIDIEQQLRLSGKLSRSRSSEFNPV